MDERGLFTARLLDASLRALAAATAVRQRKILLDGGTSLPGAAFEDLIGDTESRILHLGEALAANSPALFVDQVVWSRSAYVARGAPEENLALNIRCLREELERELPPRTHGKIFSILDQALKAFEHPAHEIESALEAPGPHRDLIRRLLLAVLDARRDDALDLVLNAIDEGMSVSQVELEVITPLQAEVGRLWQRGDLEVHEEHLGSQIVEEALILLRRRLERSEPNGKSVLVCSVAGNLHDIGSRIVADHFEMDGWKTLRLGANLPSQNLSQAVIDFEADLVALSVTMTSQVRNTASVIQHLRESLGAPAPPLLVGGPPFAQVADLWEVVGADGSSRTASGAVHEGRKLLALA